MRPGIPILARKGAKGNAFVRICFANDLGDGTSGVNVLNSHLTKKLKAKSRTFPSPPRLVRCHLRGRAAPQRTCCCERKRRDCVLQDQIYGRCRREYWGID